MVWLGRQESSKVISRATANCSGDSYLADWLAGCSSAYVRYNRERWRFVLRNITESNSTRDASNLWRTRHYSTAFPSCSSSWRPPNRSKLLDVLNQEHLEVPFLVPSIGLQCLFSIEVEWDLQQRTLHLQIRPDTSHVRTMKTSAFLTSLTGLCHVRKKPFYMRITHKMFRKRPKRLGMSRRVMNNRWWMICSQVLTRQFLSGAGHHRKVLNQNRRDLHSILLLRRRGRDIKTYLLMIRCLRRRKRNPYRRRKWWLLVIQA